MSVRRARPDDADDLVRMALALAQESEGRTPAPATVRAAVAAALADPRKAQYFVLEEDAGPEAGRGVRIVASLFVTTEWSDWTDGWYWWVQGLYVEPDRRRQGLHRRLHEAVRAAARAAGDVRSIRLYVHADNPARRAYEALGMREAPYRIYEESL